MYDNPLRVLCVFTGYLGGLPGTGRFLLTPHCEVIPMVLEGLEQLREGQVMVGGQCTRGKSNFIHSFSSLSLWYCLCMSME